MIILLDSGPLGFVPNPKVTAASRESSLWLEQLIASDHLVVIPEIVDYELRRALLRGRMRRAVSILDALALRLTFVPITTPVMRQAAEFWAMARHRGMPTVADNALDIDLILAAQAVLIEQAWNKRRSLPPLTAGISPDLPRRGSGETSRSDRSAYRTLFLKGAGP